MRQTGLEIDLVSRLCLTQTSPKSITSGWLCCHRSRRCWHLLDTRVTLCARAAASQWQRSESSMGHLHPRVNSPHPRIWCLHKQPKNAAWEILTIIRHCFALGSEMGWMSSFSVQKPKLCSQNRRGLCDGICKTGLVTFWAKLAPNDFFFSNIHQYFVSQSWSLEQEKASSNPVKIYYLVIFFSVWNQIHSSVSDLCFELLLWGRTHCSATLSKHGLVRETVEWGIHHKLWKNTQTAFLEQIKQPSNLDSSVQHHRSQRKMWSST